MKWLMMIRQIVEVGGKRYEVTCVDLGDHVKVYGERGEQQVNKHGFSAEKALWHAVNNLVRAGAVDPLDDEGQA